VITHDGHHLPPQRDVQHPGDGEAVLERLKRNASTAHYLDAAHAARIDLTERLSGGRDCHGVGVVRGRWRRAECGGGGSSVHTYKDGIDQHNSDGGPDTIRGDVREYQLLWMPDGLEEEKEGTWAMLVAVNVAVQRETAAAPQFLLSRVILKFFFCAWRTPGVRPVCPRCAPGVRQAWRRWLSRFSLVS